MGKYNNDTKNKTDKKTKNWENKTHKKNDACNYAHEIKKNLSNKRVHGAQATQKEGH